LRAERERRVRWRRDVPVELRRVHRERSADAAGRRAVRGQAHGLGQRAEGTGHRAEAATTHGGAMHVTIVNFRLNGVDEQQYASLCDQIAPAFAAVPGLISKVWIKNDTGTYGG